MEERLVDNPTEGTGDNEVEQRSEEGTYLTPAVDIYETDSAVVVLADMPGVSPGNLDVDISEGILSIAGKVISDPEVGQDLLREFRTGNYSRGFRVSDVVNRGNVTACMKDGVLKVVLPKAKNAVARRIPIATE